MKEKIKANYISWNRGWPTIRRHIPIILKPVIIALIIVVMWRTLIFPHSFSITDHSRELLFFIILPLVSFTYVIFASIAITTVFDQYKRISKSVVRKDLANFLVYRDEQLPILMHILIAVPSLIILALIMFFDYQHDAMMGAITVFTAVFIFALNWIIVVELDDFKKSIWFQEKIPQAWYDIDIDEYFAQKNVKI